MQQPTASLAIQVLPTVPDNVDAIAVVDAVIAYIKSTGLSTFVGPFETTIEGDFEKLCEIAQECQQICVREGATQVACYMKMFYNPSQGVLSIEKKVKKHHE